MRYPTILKVVVVLLLVLASWTFTSSLLAQKGFSGRLNQRASSQNAVKNQPNTDVMMTPNNGPGRVNSNTTIPSQLNIQASAKMQSSKFWVEDNTLNITATLAIFDKNPNSSYLWRVKIVNSVSNLVHTNCCYTNQIFQARGDKEQHPTFVESIPLPSGRYVVSLSLFNIPNLNTMPNLDDQYYFDQHVVLHSVENIDNL